jgi:hypothetical protein
MTVGELLTAICLKHPDAEVVIADSPFVDGDLFTIDLVTEDEQGRVVLSPDVVLQLRETA